MKRLLSIVLALMLVVGILTPSVLAGGVSGFFKYEETPDGTGIIITGIADGFGAGSYYVPATINNKPVTEIAAEAFRDFPLSSFWLPATVTRIGDSAFEGCVSFSGTVLTRDLAYIGDRAFYGCEHLNLSEAAIPENLSYIGSEAFYGCTAAGLNIDMNGIAIGENAFQNSGIVSCVLPDDMVSIPDGFFKSCASLTSVTFPSSLTSIGAEAFFSCFSLVIEELTPAIESIGDRAFFNCYALNAAVNCPDAVLGNDAFFGCGFRSYVLPDGMLGIPDGMFRENKNLVSVTFSSSLTSIGAEAFYGCTSLVLNSLPASVTAVGEGAFEGCTSLVLTALPDGITAVGARAFKGCKLFSAAVDATDMTVGAYAFSGTGIISYVFPSNEVSVPADLFKSCNALTAVTMGDNILSIGDGAFDSCKNLAFVGMGTNIVSIGTRAFYACEKLTEITLPSSLEVFGSNVFSRCTALKTVNVTEGARVLGKYAFSDCTSLTTVNLPSSITSLPERAFSGCTALEVIELPGVTSVENNAFQGCANLFDLTLKAAETLFAGNAFSGCTALGSVLFGKDVTSIDFDFFRTLSTLSILSVDSANTAYKTDEGVVLSKDGKTLLFAPHMLSGNAMIPAGVETIAPRAFEGTAIRTVVIPDSVKTIGEKAFYNCKSFVQADAGKSTAVIGKYAFGYISKNSAPVLNEEFYFRCYRGCAVYDYATENGITVQLRSSMFDANCDGNISTDDARLALRAAAQLVTLSSPEKSAADVDEDGKITTGDARFILRKAAELPVVEHVTYSSAPIGNAAILSFYKYAVNRVRIGDEASYREKQWADIKKMKIDGVGTSSSEDLLKPFLPAESEEEAEELVRERGKNAKSNMYPCTLEQLDSIELSSCTELDNGNYSIMLMLRDEVNPTADTSSIGKVIPITYKADLSAALGNYMSVSELDSEYRNFILSAEITKDGRFVSLLQMCDVNFDMTINVLYVKNSAECDFTSVESKYGFVYAS